MGIKWKDMAVTNLPTGQPVMHVTGWAAERVKELTPAGYESILHVTLTDDHPWAQAFVVLEARPLNAHTKTDKTAFQGQPVSVDTKAPEGQDGGN